MKGKILYIFVLIFIIVLIFTPVNIASTTTQLSIVKNEADTKYLENDQGYLDKKIISSNAETGEVTVQLSLNNKKKEQEGEQVRYENTEIFIMVPVSISNEKKEEYSAYIETLANKVFDANSKTKIGIIGLEGTVRDSELDEDGNLVWGENDEGDVLGSEDEGEIVVNLTNNISDLTNGILNMNPDNIGYYINLQSAIRLAKNSYSNNINKILISLYDNVPSIAIGVKSEVSHGGIFSEYDTTEEAVIGKHEKIVSYTKNEILSLANENIDFILLRPDDTSFDQKWYSTTTGELSLEFDGSPYVQDLYGTLDNPTYGKMYSLNNDSLEKIVTEYIYTDIIETVGTTMESIEVKDYFPQDILNNFDISFSDSTNLDFSTLQEEGYITWNIEKLDREQTATIEYTLKIRNINNTQLLNKEIATNERVELTYVDYEGTEKEAILESSPIIKLVNIELPDNNNININTDNKNTGLVDNTIAPGKIPQTGKTITIIAIVSIIAGLGILWYTKLRKMKDIK